VRPDGWIEYEPLLDEVGLTGETTRVEGIRNADGDCSFEGSSSAESSEGLTSYREEVAYNPATCESDVLVVMVSGVSATVSFVGKMCRNEKGQNGSTTAPSCVENDDPKTDSPLFLVHLSRASSLLQNPTHHQT